MLGFLHQRQHRIYSEICVTELAVVSLCKPQGPGMQSKLCKYERSTSPPLAPQDISTSAPLSTVLWWQPARLTSLPVQVIAHFFGSSPLYAEVADTAALTEERLAVVVAVALAVALPRASSSHAMRASACRLEGSMEATGRHVLSKNTISRPSVGRGAAPFGSCRVTMAVGRPACTESEQHTSNTPVAPMK